MKIFNKELKNKIIWRAIFIASAVFTSSSVFAQTTTTQHKDPADTAYLMLGIILFALAVLFASLMIFEAGERKPAKAKPARKSKIEEYLATEKDHLLGDEYDGIKELDNKAPAWFQFLFYGSIVFAIVYMLNFHVLGKNNLMLDEYVQEMTVAAQQREELIRTGALINENTAKLLTDPADIAKGKDVFAANCVSCHGNNGEGIVGPNLTDDYWIHGGGIKNIFTTIKVGVPAKGMISWQTTLNPKQMEAVSSYVISLKGTNPPKGKAPEGTIYIDSTATGIKTDSLKSKEIKTDSTKTGKK